MPSGDPAGLRYDELQRRGPAGAWRPVAGIPLLLVIFFAGQLVLSLVVTLVLVVGGDSGGEAVDKLSGDPATPSFLALVNLGWAAAIPAVWVVARLLHGQTPGWVTSVAGTLRWRWFAACLGLAVVALGLTLVVSALLPDQGSGSLDTSAGLNPWTSTVRDFVLVIVLLTPLQAAGEEYVFRGYLAQAFGGLTARAGARVGAAVSVVVPALLFALAHGLGQDAPVFFDRFAFGVVAGLLVILTGGLEAGIAMHVVNNFVAFGMALAFSDMTEALNPTGGSWWSIPVTVVQSVGYLLLAVGAARRLGVQNRTETPEGGAILEAEPADR
ncbi:CPBP family intramembrane glutamic endopeptidase [Nocardioides daeguensis]|uniref:CAAX prenyl protease 2/Lysostaphin resistance protein A-like domain-containing protein n=1 Tax=Nocardioides daeguensis TaxID=908359 RepID=A0ABP6UWR0_9ACTN|nr:CPBP family intramembrane glutamic endopeptidase [Nocardioides daeguensis]MBV6729179.1 CPBP family intramembrane metalloprotease [Nocardioides daeguensis]MCR1774817.1 CPBP family intramembrane metalloprotease [Nocardioides daeguensis]